MTGRGVVVRASVGVLGSIHPADVSSGRSTRDANRVMVQAGSKNASTVADMNLGDER